MRNLLFFAVFFSIGCSGESSTPILPTTPPATSEPAPPPPPTTVELTVTLDGSPIAGAWVSVGGSSVHGLTDANGKITVAMEGSDTIIASHPDARIRASIDPEAIQTLELSSFSLTDNVDYIFQDPGIPGEAGNTSQCGHCHGSMVIDWDASPHRTSVSNPVVQSVYAGTALFPDESTCVAQGGIWREGLGPGSRSVINRCYLGGGTLPDLNDDCGDLTSCDGVATNTGGCADCHAPGIDGLIGGRDLLDATGRSFEKGVHCDVCHKVESVDLSAPPGVAGALHILRPSELASSPNETWSALTFGPFPDVANPRMGAVLRDHFQGAEFCGGCHELVQSGPIAGDSVDPSRWPDGLPIHSTYTEWEAGRYAPMAPCQSCHMPPDPRWLNAWDFEEADISFLPPSIATGWPRPPGTTRRHLWGGPRAVDGELLALAGALDLSTEQVDDALAVGVRVTNIGAGHALPTGEPSRSVLLLVNATCNGEALLPTGGDVVPSFGGALDQRAADEDWGIWPGAAVGDRIRVIATGEPLAYEGPGRFGDGSFSPEQKGLTRDHFVDEAAIIAVEGDTITLDHPLQAGDLAYRVDGYGEAYDGEPIVAWAGAPGFAFARVLVDAAGEEQVPHHRAIDISSDNRLMPGASFSTTHTFNAPCATPTVTARLLHRPYALHQDRARNWAGIDQILAEAIR